MFVTVGTHLGLAPVLASIAVIIGHSKSCFLGFKGGKSVASGVGTILALNWVVGAIIAVIWAIITYFTKNTNYFFIILLFATNYRKTRENPHKNQQNNYKYNFALI